MMRWCECALTSSDNKRPVSHSFMYITQQRVMLSQMNNRVFAWRQHIVEKKRLWCEAQWRQQLGIVFTFDSINLTLLTCHQHFPQTPFSLLYPFGVIVCHLLLSIVVLPKNLFEKSRRRKNFFFSLLIDCINEYKQSSLFAYTTRCFTDEGCCFLTRMLQ